MILLECDWFDVYKDGYKTGEKEFVASHGIDLDTDKLVIVQCVHPSKLGATQVGDDWYIEDKEQKK